MKFDYWAARKTDLYFRFFGLMTWILETATLEVLTKVVIQFNQLRHWKNTDINRKLLMDFS